MGTRRTVVLTVLVASALAWPPARRLLADVLITVGAHLDHLDDPTGPTPEQRERMRLGFVDELAAALLRRRQTDKAVPPRPDGRNGTTGETVI